MIELKPCPFCGRLACVAVSNSRLFGRWYAKVSCEMNGGCGAAVKIEAHSDKTAKRRAIEVWNMIAGLVKHGRWELWGDEIYMAFKCSACGVEIDEDYYNVAHTYCPNCGAKMDEEGGDD